VYRDAEDLINIGAYSKGSNMEIDEAIGKIKEINGFLQQEVEEVFDFSQVVDRLKQIHS